MSEETNAKIILTELFKKQKALEEKIVRLEEATKMDKKEEPKMKENEASKDTQVTPAQPDSAGKYATQKVADASQDEMGKKYAENEADKNLQQEPQAVQNPSGDIKPKDASQDNMSDKYKEDGNGEQDDMGKVIEMINALSKRIEALEVKGQTPATEQVDEKPPVPAQQQQTAQEEPKAPIVEKFNPGKILFKENQPKSELKESVKNLFAKK